MPKVTCNPRAGLKANQYINGNCFSPTVTPGEQGTYVFPTLTGPGFFNTDISVFKNFTWGASETKKIQFRFSGYNFLNHPVRTFVQNDPGLNLTFNSSGKPLAKRQYNVRVRQQQDWPPYPARRGQVHLLIVLVRFG